MPGTGKKVMSPEVSCILSRCPGGQVCVKSTACAAVNTSQQLLQPSLEASREFCSELSAAWQTLAAGAVARPWERSGPMQAPHFPGPLPSLPASIRSLWPVLPQPTFPLQNMPRD